MSEAGEERGLPGAVQFRLFGGVGVERNGVEIAVTQPKQRAILALLLARPGVLVTVAEIIEALWSCEPAASALNQIHRHVGALRRICEPDLPRREAGRYVASAGQAYRLMVAADDCDVLLFRDLIFRAQRQGKDGRRRDALQSYAAALRIASEPAGNDDVRHLPAFVGLDDERLQALVAASALCDTPDEHAALLPLLRAEAARHPLNEALHAQEIIALRRTGRAADAAVVYSTIRETLAQELGTTPGAGLEDALTRPLCQAETMVDSHDGVVPARQGPSAATILPVPWAPAQLPSALPAFTGRRTVRAALRQQTERKLSTLLITGMPGVGKTSLALRHAADVAAEYPDGQLYVNLRAFDAIAPPVDPFDALHDLLHGAGVAVQAMPSSLGARSGLLRSVLAGRRLLLLLDNALDYRQVEPLLPGSGDNVVVVTSRNRMPGLTAFHQAQSVELGPFDDEEVVEFFIQRFLAERVLGHREDLLRLGRACGGLPLALAVVAARAHANPRFPLDMFVREVIDAAHQGPLQALNAGSSELDLRTVFSWSRHGLSEPAAAAFVMLAAHPGPDISTAATASMLGRTGEGAQIVLAELAEANVLRVAAPGRYSFHDLVRAYALELLGDGFADASARLINHYVHSTGNAIATFGQRPSATGAAKFHGVVAEEFASSAGATAWYGQHRHVLRALCRRAVELGDHQSALMLMLDWRPMSQAIDARKDMLPFAEVAIEAAGQVEDPVLRAEAYRDAASNFARTDQPERAQTFFELAATAYRESGDRLGLSGVFRSMALMLPMDADERIRLLTDSVAVARDADDQATLALALQSLGLAHLWDGRPKEALAMIEAADAAAVQAVNLQYLRPHLASARARALARLGRLTEAAQEAQEALDAFRRDGAAHAELRLLYTHGDVLTSLGFRREAAVAWRRYLELASGPNQIRETNSLYDNDPDGQATIAQVRAQLADLEDDGRP